MKIINTLLALILTLSPAFVKAASLSVNIAGFKFTLTDTKCTNKPILDNTDTDFAKKLNSGSVVFPDGSKRQLCWLVMEGHVLMMDEKLEQVPPIPLGQFQPSVQDKKAGKVKI